MNANPLAINLLPSIFAEAGFGTFAANKILLSLLPTFTYFFVCLSSGLIFLGLMLDI